MKKIGIVTFNDARNYGAFLQEYALQKVLNENGFDAKIINYENERFRQQYDYSMNLFKKKGLKNKLKIIYFWIFHHSLYKDRRSAIKKFFECEKNEINLSIKYSENNKEYFNKTFDYFVAGSDQIFNVRITMYNTFYLLDFVKDARKKKSYAASFGRSSFDKSDLKFLKDNIPKFDNCLVREKSGEKILKDIGINSKVVVDPTLLLGKHDWQSFGEKADNELPSNYIVIYIVAISDITIDVALKYAQKNNCNIIFLGWKNRDMNYKGKVLKASVNTGPYDFVNYIAHAEMIFTTSFHGMILSINLNKPFYYGLSTNIYNNNARLEDMAKLLGLENRAITSDILNESIINWKEVNEKLSILRGESKQYLLDSLREKN